MVYEIIPIQLGRNVIPCMTYPTRGPFFIAQICAVTQECVFNCTNTLGFQPPLKQWVEKYNHHCLPKGFNHPNWVNHYFNGGGSPGNIYPLMYSVDGNQKSGESLPPFRCFWNLVNNGINCQPQLVIAGCFSINSTSMIWDGPIVNTTGAPGYSYGSKSSWAIAVSVTSGGDILNVWHYKKWHC